MAEIVGHLAHVRDLIIGGVGNPSVELGPSLPPISRGTLSKLNFSFNDIDLCHHSVTFIN